MTFLPGNRRKSRERGATIVEAAIIVPLLLLMVIAIMEYGLAFKDYLTVSYLSREGARLGALAGDSDTADCDILTGLADLITPGDLARIDYIEIYEADQSSGNQGATNRATYTDPNDPNVCTEPSGGQPGDGWSITPIGGGYPTGSRNTAASPTTPLDIIGVRVVLTRSWITGFGPFSGTATVDETTITRMEPEVFG
ncbi:MAG: pilus assembly protein [Acidimicrobiia bacterium]